MNNDSPPKSGANGPGPAEEKWISRQDVKKLFPSVQDRQLKYWRESKQIRSYTKRNQTFYIESEVRDMAKHNSRPLRYVRRRLKWIQKKLPSVNPVLLIAGLTVLFLFVVRKSYFKNPTYGFSDFAMPFYFLLFFCAIYGIVKLIQYFWARYFPKPKN